MTAREILTSIAVCSAALVIVVQAVKQVLPQSWLPWLPLGTIVFGMAGLSGLALLIGLRGESVIDAALVGLFGAGSAVGFYDVQKPTGVLPGR